MARPRFSDFLSNRRRQLGLTIPQASRVLRLKEQVLVAFEEGDWERIPRSGYAQGMLSSYARYLGLNPREVIDLFQDDLHAYANGQGAGPSRRQHRDDPSSGRGRQGVVAPSRDHDLYGSAGPAGSILSGTLVGSSYLHNAEERRGSSPLVNGRSAGYSERYLRQNGYATPGAEGGSLPPAGGTTPERDYPQGRPYTARAPRTDRSRRTAAAGRSTTASARAGRSRSTRARQDARRYASTDIQTRDVSSTMYDDDLRYGLAADTYRQASSAEVRESARTQAPAPQRPNVRRRPSAADRYRPSQRPSRQPRSGVLGVVDAWFSDPRRTMLTVFVALGVLLIVVIVLSVRSCTAPAPEGGNRDQVAASQPATQDASDTSSDDGSATAGDGQAQPSSTTTAATQDDANEPVEVQVSVPEGAAVWVEVKNGERNEVAQTVTGPWEQKFTVDGELEVRTADPTQVTVTANGQPVSFDTSAAGIGTATVKGPSTDDQASGDGSDGQGSDAGSSDASGDTGSAAPADGSDTSSNQGQSRSSTSSSGAAE
ncbi:helix-turn-helix domain-containing protein [Caniella muris]|uniref:helix-turn-helix domain-containing protein n=1 Tax=Caniella muris TaxID=2941502 RepID=UPI002040CCFF|nr:helix-turn-helix domain-containing protein [Caniella muris]